MPSSFLPLYLPVLLFFYFFFNDTATTEIYTLSLHDALPICGATCVTRVSPKLASCPGRHHARSEEHTSELQSRRDLVCRLLLEKKKNMTQEKSSNISSVSLTSMTTPRQQNLPPTPSILLLLR